MENVEYKIKEEPKKKFNLIPLLVFIGLYILECFSPLLFYNRETESYKFSLSVIWFISKIIPLVVVIIVYRNYFLSDFKKTKDNIKKFFLFTLLSFVIFYASNLSSTYYETLMDKILNIGEASNQEGIYEYFRSSKTFTNYFVLFMTIVVLAPILEEFEYRFLVYKTFEGCHFVVTALLSGLLFGLAHMQFLTTNELNEIIFDINELIYLPIYFIPGLALAFIYHYSNHNIYANILVHMTTNLISFVVIIFSGVI